MSEMHTENERELNKQTTKQTNSENEMMKKIAEREPNESIANTSCTYGSTFKFVQTPLRFAIAIFFFAPQQPGANFTIELHTNVKAERATITEPYRCNEFQVIAFSWNPVEISLNSSIPLNNSHLHIPAPNTNKIQS